MKKFGLLTKLSLFLAFILLVAAVAAGCGEEQNDVAVTSDMLIGEQIGEGKYTFDFTAVTLEERFAYTVSTDCETVGEALLTLGLIAGENGPFGLYVKSVCGVIADYDTDKTYWALYTDGEMSMAGADAVKCADVSSVEFKVEK